MSKYEASALAQADAYEKERKKQADAVIAQITADADAKTQAAVDETGAAIRTEQRSLLDTVDAAAVERQVTLGQAKEALARLGLTGSGRENAARHAAAVTETRRTEHARRTRDDAVAALTEALSRREQEIAQARDAAVLEETLDAEQDALTERNKLLEAAYKAEATETAAKLKVSQAARETAARAATSVAKDAAAEAESIRKTALKELLKQQHIHPEVYIDALQQGWGIEETRRRQIEWVKWRETSDTFGKTYRRDGFDAMITQLASYDITDRQLKDICFELRIDEDKVRAALAKERSRSR